MLIVSRVHKNSFIQFVIHFYHNFYIHNLHIIINLYVRVYYVLCTTGHSLSFLVSETYGEESTSILETAELWKKNISAFIGPQETCLHEARMAAAFNLPMISYVSQYKSLNF